MHGALAPRIIGNDANASRWLINRGAVANPAAGLPADLAHAVGPIKTSDLMGLDDLGLRLAISVDAACQSYVRRNRPQSRDL